MDTVIKETEETPDIEEAMDDFLPTDVNIEEHTSSLNLVPQPTEFMMFLSFLKY